MRRVLVFPALLLLALTASVAPGARAAVQPDAVPATAAAPAAFSAPAHVATGSFWGVAEVVDSTNHVHIAATGKGGVWYITNHTGTWSSHKILSNPSDGDYAVPLIAIDEQDRVHIAATVQTGQECPLAPLGIFYVTDKGRTRGTFPSTATRIGPAGRNGTSLKVSNGHIYLTMEPDGCYGPGGLPLWFRTNASGHWVTTKLGNGWAPSMRLATNGHARIVYNGQSALHYAVAATASGGFSTTTIPHTTGEDIHPMLSLDTQGYAAAAWTHSPYAPGPETVRYSTRKSGSWSAPVTVATSSDGFDAVAFDMDTLGRPNIVIANTGDDRMLRDVRLAGGTWTTSTIAGPIPLVRAVSVHRAFSGRVVVAWATNSGIYVSRG